MESKLILLLLLIIFSCTPPSPINPAERFFQAQQQGKYQEYYVYIDSRFQGQEQREINQALNLWNQKTYNYVRWKIRIWPDNYWKSSSKVCNKLLIFREHSLNKAVFDIERKSKTSIIGYTDFDSEKCGTDTIILVVDKFSSNTELRRILVHEIGHVLGLTHDKFGRIPYFPKSVMSYSWMRFLDGPTEYDLTWLIKINNL